MNGQDETEMIRMVLAREINSHPSSKEALEAVYGKVWDTAELSWDFEVKGFAAPFVVVERKADHQVGSLTFQHMPRFYFDFVADEEVR